MKDESEAHAGLFSSFVLSLRGSTSHDALRWGLLRDSRPRLDFKKCPTLHLPTIHYS
jgi:hypothetical protein